MKKIFLIFFILAQIACAQLIPAQSLAGTWVSERPILIIINFSLTFNTDMTYKIDCIFGKTLGTYTIEEGKIIFTPTNVGIINVKAKDIGNIDIYAYKLIDEDGLYLSGGRYSVTLIRKEVYEKKLKEQQSLSPRKGR